MCVFGGSDTPDPPPTPPPPPDPPPPPPLVDLPPVTTPTRVVEPPLVEPPPVTPTTNLVTGSPTDTGTPTSGGPMSVGTMLPIGITLAERNRLAREFGFTGSFAPSGDLYAQEGGQFQQWLAADPARGAEWRKFRDTKTAESYAPTQTQMPDWIANPPSWVTNPPSLPTAPAEPGSGDATLRKRLRNSRWSTVLTSALGLSDAGPVGKKLLLGH